MIFCETEPKPGKPGRRIPVDADPDRRGFPLLVPGGNLNFTGEAGAGSTPIVRYVPKAFGHHVTHFSSCPNAKEFRRPR